MDLYVFRFNPTNKEKCRQMAMSKRESLFLRVMVLILKINRISFYYYYNEGENIFVKAKCYSELEKSAGIKASAVV